ncbi:hypothetical protein BH10PSE1_BH10PSE1_31800 [soil metagenome]
MMPDHLHNLPKPGEPIPRPAWGWSILEPIGHTGFKPRVCFWCPVAGKGAGPCDLVAAGACGAGRSTSSSSFTLGELRVPTPLTGNGGRGARGSDGGGLVGQGRREGHGGVQGTDTQGVRPPAGGAVAARGQHPHWFVATRAVQLPTNHTRGAFVFRRNGISILISGRRPGRSAGPSHSRRLAAGQARMTSARDRVRAKRHALFPFSLPRYTVPHVLNPPP